MKIKLKQKITADHRIEIARYLSFLIEGHEHSNVPYMPDESDEYYWTLDRMNNWKVQFDPGDKCCFEIRHRYRIDAVGVLSRWVSYHYGAVQEATNEAG